MSEIFWHSLRDRKSSLIAYCGSAILLLWMYVSLYPSIQKQSAQLNQLVEHYPKGVLKAFGIENLDLGIFGNFLATEQFSIVWPLLAIFLLVSFAGGALAGEIETGTMELLLSQPISRLSLYFQRVFAALTSLIIFTFFSVLAIIPMATVYGIDYYSKGIFAMTLLSLLFGFGVLGLSFGIASSCSEKGRVNFIAGGLLLGMYVLNLAASLKESLGNLKYFSFFHYFNPGKALVEGTVDSTGIAVFIGVGIVGILSGAIWFNRRDLIK